MLAHITFSMCFATVVISSRLVTFDRSLKEAAEDLCASPVGAFFSITLPIIAPAINALSPILISVVALGVIVVSFAGKRAEISRSET